MARNGAILLAEQLPDNRESAKLSLLAEDPCSSFPPVLSASCGPVFVIHCPGSAKIISTEVSIRRPCVDTHDRRPHPPPRPDRRPHPHLPRPDRRPPPCSAPARLFSELLRCSLRPPSAARNNRDRAPVLLTHYFLWPPPFMGRHAGLGRRLPTRFCDEHRSFHGLLPVSGPGQVR